MTTNVTPSNTVKLKVEITLYQDGHYEIQANRASSTYLPAKQARLDTDTRTGRWRYERWERTDHLPQPIGRLEVDPDFEGPDWRVIVGDMLNVPPDPRPLAEVVYPHVIPSGAGFDWQMEKRYRWAKTYHTREQAEDKLATYMAQLTLWMNVHSIDDLDYWPLTPGQFTLEDINQGAVRHRQTHPYAHPSVMTLGRFEVKELSTWVMGNRDVIPERSESDRFKPFELFGMTAYPVDRAAGFQVLG